MKNIIILNMNLPGRNQITFDLSVPNL